MPLIDMANVINQSKIVLTDTGLPRSRYGKYIEIFIGIIDLIKFYKTKKVNS